MGLARRTTATKRLKASAAPVVAPSKPKGIPGGGNYSGRIQTTEPNALLREQAGFGRAGTQSIGEWADLALTNPFVTAGLDFICAPIADARIDIEVDETEAPKLSKPARKLKPVVEDEALAAGKPYRDVLSDRRLKAKLRGSAGKSEDNALKELEDAEPLEAKAALQKQQVDFLKWALEKRFRLAAHNDSAARGFLVSGFALYEPRAELVPCPVLGRDAFVLAALEQRLPNSLSPNAWREDGEGRLTDIEQQGPKGGNAAWTTLLLPAKDVLLYSWKRLGNNWAGESQLRSVWYLAARIMPLLLKLVGVTTQREGAGLPVAFAKDDQAEITPDQRAELMTFFANVSFHEASGIVLPKGFDVKWIHSPGSDKGFVLDIWKALGLVVLQQLGAQQMVLGTDNTGSRSVGEVHDARAMAFVRKVLSFQEGVLNGDGGESHTGLVSRLLKWNGLLGEGTPPRVKLTPKRPEMALSELAAAMVSLKGAGLFTPTADDENVIRERAGFPPLSEEDRETAKEKAAALAPQLQPGFPKPGEKDEPLKASAQRSPWQPWRPLRASERNTDFKKLDEYFTAQREVFAALVRPVVATMLGVAAPAIAAAMADGKVQPAEIAAVPLDTRRLKATVAKYVASVRAFAHDTVRAEMPHRPLMAAAGDGDSKEDDDFKGETDDVLDSVVNATVRRMEQRARAELEREAIDALRTGEGAQSVVERALLRQLDSTSFRADAGTLTTKSFNVSRDEAARIMGGIASVQYSALLDSATCDPCRAMDGQTAAFNSPEHDAMLPPNRDCAGGDNCRCILTLIPGTPEVDE